MFSNFEVLPSSLFSSPGSPFVSLILLISHFISLRLCPSVFLPSCLSLNLSSCCMQRANPQDLTHILLTTGREAWVKQISQVQWVLCGFSLNRTNCLTHWSEPARAYMEVTLWYLMYSDRCGESHEVNRVNLTVLLITSLASCSQSWEACKCAPLIRPPRELWAVSEAELLAAGWSVNPTE